MTVILGPFSSAEVSEFLADYGYVTHPKGLAQPFWPSFDGDNPFVDIPADAVRKNGEVPDRPIRLTFHLVFNGTSDVWKLKSVEELAPGVKSKAQDRHPDTPKKNAPWT